MIYGDSDLGDLCRCLLLSHEFSDGVGGSLFQVTRLWKTNAHCHGVSIVGDGHENDSRAGGRRTLSWIDRHALSRGHGKHVSAVSVSCCYFN